MHFYNRSNPSYMQSHLEAGWLFCCEVMLPHIIGYKFYPYIRIENK
jgi:hypothetical protein